MSGCSRSVVAVTCEQVVVAAWSSSSSSSLQVRAERVWLYLGQDLLGRVEACLVVVGVLSS